MKPIEKGKYKITYRLPNIIESMYLVADLGVDPENPTVKGPEQMRFMGKLMETSAKFIVKIEKEGKEITWDESIIDRGFVDPLTEVAYALMANFNGEKSTKRKKS